MKKSCHLILMIIAMVVLLASTGYACSSSVGDPLVSNPKASWDGSNWGQTEFCADATVYFRAFASDDVSPAPLRDKDRYNGQVVYDAVEYTWTFGDGTSGVGIDVTHTYKSPGTYVVTLTAKDVWQYWNDTDASKSIKITVEECSPIVYVNTTDGNDDDSGRSWDQAKKTIQRAIDIAVGKEVWVAKGTYDEEIALKKGVRLYGGFGGNEKNRDERNWGSNQTSIQGNGHTSVITVDSSATNDDTVISGFWIRDGGGTQGGGICCIDTSPTISDNVITNNIVAGTTDCYGGGIYCGNSSAAIYDNWIANNKATKGYAIASVGSNLAVVNNTIANCRTSSSTSGGSVYSSESTLLFGNNIVADNDSGIVSDGINTITLTTNCVYGNGQNNYVGLNPGISDISDDPDFLLKQYSANDFHISEASCCCDKGTSSLVPCGARDIDGEYRIANNAVDIGADESAGITPVAADVSSLCVGGDDIQATRLTNGTLESASQVYVLTNTGNATINWTATKGQSWVALSAASGTLAPQQSTFVTVSIDASAAALLQPGQRYCDTVVFSNSSNSIGNTSRSVNLAVLGNGPHLSVRGPANSDVKFWKGDTYAQQCDLIYTLENNGDQDLSWSAALADNTKNWCVLSSPSSGTLPSRCATTVTVKLYPLLVDELTTYSNIINFVSGSTTIPMSFSLTVALADLVVIDDNGSLAWHGPVGGPMVGELTNGTTSASKTFRLENWSTRPLAWHITKTPNETTDWVDIQQNSGELAPKGEVGSTTNVTISCNQDAAKILPGYVNYEAAINFVNESGSGNTTRPVNLNLYSSGPGYISVDCPATADNGRVNFNIPAGLALDPQKTFKYVLRNTGATSVSWEAIEASDWISVSPQSGTLDAYGGNNSSVEVTVTTNITANTFTDAGVNLANIAFVNTTVPGNSNRGEDNPCQIVATATRPGVGNLTAMELLNNTLIAMGQLQFKQFPDITIPKSRTIRLYNSGDSPIQWQATPSAGWLQLMSDSGEISGNNGSFTDKNYTDMQLSVDVVSATTQGSVLIENVSRNDHDDDITLNVDLTVLNPGDGLTITPNEPLMTSGPCGSDRFGSVNYNAENQTNGSIPWDATLDNWTSSLGNIQHWAKIDASNSVNPLTAGSSTPIVIAISGAASGLPTSLNSVDAYIAPSCGSGKRTVWLNVTGSCFSVSGPTVVDAFGVSGGPFYFGPSSSSNYSFRLANSRNDNLTWTATTDKSWITVTPSNGPLSSNGICDVNVAIIAANAPQTDDTGTITFIAKDSSNQEVGRAVRTVHLSIMNKGVRVIGDSILASRSESGLFVVYEPADGDPKYILTNTQTTQVRWNASVTSVAQNGETYVPSWIKLPSGGTLPSVASNRAPLDVSVAVDFDSAVVNSLDGGTYQATIKFTFEGVTSGPTSVEKTVTLNVAGPKAKTIIRVDCSDAGNDTNDGSSWDTPMRTINAALNNLPPAGGEIWVRGGVRDNASKDLIKYCEALKIGKSGIAIYGGFSGTEGDLTSRDWRTNETIISGNTTASVVSILNTDCAAIDGFTIEGGGGSAGGGISCMNASPVIAHNNITQCTLSGSGDLFGAGIYCDGSNATIINNAVTGNKISSATGTGGGIYCVNCSPKIYNNTITDNEAPTAGSAYFINANAEVINNIFALNSSGLSGEGTAYPSFWNNDFWSNSTGLPYGTLPLPPTGNKNIDTNPNLQPNKINVETNSPCLNAGTDISPITNSALDIGAWDFDHRERELQNYVDIGACEATACFANSVTVMADNQSPVTGFPVAITVLVNNRYTASVVSGCTVHLSIVGDGYFKSTGDTVYSNNPAAVDAITDINGRINAIMVGNQAGIIVVTATIAACNTDITQTVKLNCRDRGNWPMFMHDSQHTGVAEDVGINPGYYELMWTAPVSTAQSYYDKKWSDAASDYVQDLPMLDSSPVTYGNRVIVGEWNPEDESGGVRAFDAKTGQPIWTTESSTAMGGVSSTPCIYDNKVYVGSSDGYLYCFDLETGNRRWALPTYNRSMSVSKIVASPVVHNDVVYVGNDAGVVYAFDAQSANGAYVFSPTILGGSSSNEVGCSSPAIASVNGRDYLLVLCGDGGFYRITLQDPPQDLNGPLPNLETTSIQFSSSRCASPVVSKNVAYVSAWKAGTAGSATTDLHAVSIDPFVVSKSSGAGDYYFVQTPALDHGSLYFSDRLISTSTLQQEKTLYSDACSYYCYSSPAVDSGRLYVGDVFGNLFGGRCKPADPNELPWDLPYYIFRMRLYPSYMMYGSLHLGVGVRSTAAISHNVDPDANMWLYVTSRQDGGTLYAYRATQCNTIAPLKATPEGSFYKFVSGHPVMVSLECPTDGTAIRYTLDATTPTEASTLYTGPIAISSTTTISAKAFKVGMNDSPMLCETYMSQPPQPTITPDGGSYPGGVTAVVSCGRCVPKDTLIYVEPDNVLLSAREEYDQKMNRWLDAWYSDDGGDEYNVIPHRPQDAPPSYIGTCMEYGIYHLVNGSAYDVNDTTSLHATAHPLRGYEWNTEHQCYMPGLYAPFYVDEYNYENWGQQPYLRDTSELSDGFDSTSICASFTTGASYGAPELSPSEGTYYVAALNVEMHRSPYDWGAQNSNIYYTIDGSDPRVYGKPYVAPITLTNSTTVRAVRLMLDGNYDYDWRDIVGTHYSRWSAETVATYNLAGTVATPTINPSADTPFTSAPVSVSMNCPTPNTQIHYTCDESEPTLSSTLYTGPVSISSPVTIRAKAFVTNGPTSGVARAVYDFKVPDLTFSPGTGSYTGTSVVAISYNNPVTNAKLYWTTDGNDPTPQYYQGVSYQSTTNVTLYKSTALKARAYKTDSNWKASGIQSAIYTINNAVVAPQFDPPSNTADPSGLLVHMYCATDGASIHYTTDGSTPSASSLLYSDDNPVQIDHTLTLKAIACKEGMTSSAITSVTYTVNGSLPSPTFNPVGNIYPSSRSVSLACSVSGADIYYTLDGSLPAVGNSTTYKYAQPIAVTTNKTIKAIAKKLSWLDSDVSVAEYVIKGTLAAPVFTPPGGTYTSAQSVWINADKYAQIYYTTDGTSPASSATAVLYSDGIPIVVDKTTTLKAIAKATGFTNSAITSATYTIAPKVAKPVITPGGGEVNQSLAVKISCATTDAAIYYTNDGTVPTTSSNLYVKGALISVSHNQTIKAIAVKSGMANSDIAVETYAFKVAMPAFDVPGGIYTNTQSVVITCATPGAQIRYTDDGTDPGDGTSQADTSVAYNGEILSISSDTTLKAIAFAAGYASSDIGVADYQITSDITEIVSTPVFDPAPPETGPYVSTDPIDVEILCAETSAGDPNIYYTIDGSEPTEASTLYTGPIHVSSNTTIKARAYRPGFAHSAVATAEYAITNAANVVATPTFTPAGPYPYILVDPANVTISCCTAGADIYYTTDGSEPTRTSQLYTTPINVSSDTTIKARAYKLGMLDSALATAEYKFTSKVATPKITPNGGVYRDGEVANVSCSPISGARIYYTTNNSDPTQQDTEWIAGTNIQIMSKTTLKARAFASGLAPSDVATAKFGFVRLYLPNDPKAFPGWAADAAPTDFASGGNAGPSASISVDLASGVSESNPASDIVVYNPSGPDVAYTRLYRSSLAASGAHSLGLSSGWVDNFSIRIIGGSTWDDPVLLCYPNGAIDKLQPLTDATGLVIQDSVAILNPTSKAPFYATGCPGSNPGNWQSITIKSADGSSCTFTLDPATDAEYRPAKITDISGNYVNINYRTDGCIDNITASDSTQLMTFEYNGSQLARVRDRVGGMKVEYWFDQNLSYVSDLVPDTLTNAPVYWQYNYDGSQLTQVSVPDPSGTTGTGTATSIINYENGRVDSIVDANGNSHNYNYGAGGTDVTVNSDSPWTQKIGNNSQDVGVIDQNGNNTYASYDGFLLTSVTNSNNQTTKFDYDAFGNLTKSVESDGEITDYTYDTAGTDIFHRNRFNLLQVSERLVGQPEGTYNRIPTNYEYDSLGRLHKVSTPRPGMTLQHDGNKQVSSYFYYTSKGNLSSVVSPAPSSDGVVSTCYYYTNPEREGLPCAEAVLNGEYDTPPANPTGYSNLVSYSSYEYDSQGRVTRVWDAYNNETRIIYDDVHYATFVYDPPRDLREPTKRKVTAYYYRTSNGPLYRVEEWGENTDWNSGNAEPMHVLDLTYGPESEVLEEYGTQPGAAYQYDNEYRVSHVRDDNGHSTKYEYDAVGNLKSLTCPMANGVGWEFDKDGNPTAATDGKGTTRYHRDPATSRVGDIVSPDEHIHYEYDSFGRVISESNNTATVSYTYDDCDQVTTVTTTYSNGPNDTISYAYYPDGSRCSMTSNALGTYTYAYTGLQTIVGFPWNRQQVTCNYDLNGQITSQVVGRPDDSYVETDYEYDNCGFLTYLRNQNIKSGSVGLMSEFSNIDYYDSGNLKSFDASMDKMYTDDPYESCHVEYEYDEQDRLTREVWYTSSSGNKIYEYTAHYDAVGNLTSVTRSWNNATSADPDNYETYIYGYDGNDNLISRDGNLFDLFDYDANYNPLRFSPTPECNFGLTYDASDRPTSISGCISGEVRYQYRSDDLRSSKLADGVTTYYFYDDDDILYETSGNQYVAYGYGPNGLVERADDSTFRIYTFDPLGSTNAIVMSTNNLPVSIRYVYDSAGLVLDSVHEYSTGGTVDAPPAEFGYMGQYGVYSDIETCPASDAVTQAMGGIAAANIAGSAWKNTVYCVHWAGDFVDGLTSPTRESAAAIWTCVTTGKPLIDVPALTTKQIAVYKKYGPKEWALWNKYQIEYALKDQFPNGHDPYSIGRFLANAAPLVAGAAEAGNALAARGEAENMANQMRPHKEGGGHHPGAKAAMRKKPAGQYVEDFNPREAPCIPRDLMTDEGWNHRAITAAQRKAYKAFEKSGKPISWKNMEKIEVDAMVKGGVPRNIAKAFFKRYKEWCTARKIKPRRIPWSK